jgi:hypothetical protein
MPEINILDDVLQSTDSSSSQLKAITSWGHALQVYDANIASLETKLKELKAERLRVAVEVLPDIMASVGLSNFRMTDGYTIDIKPFVDASLPSKEAIEKAKSAEERQELVERKQRAFDYLREHNAESLIKTVVKVDFAKGANITGLMNMLKRWSKLVKTASFDETVHASTLKSYAKEQIEAGTPLPSDVFAVHTGRMAMVIAPKPNK